MFRDFENFVRSLWNEWKVLLTGGTLIAGIFIWSALVPRPLPRQTNWVILGFTLILASFFAWRKEWIRNQRGLIDIMASELNSASKRQD